MYAHRPIREQIQTYTSENRWRNRHAVWCKYTKKYKKNIKKIRRETCMYEERPVYLKRDP